MALVCKRTILNGRPPHVSEISAKFCRKRMSHGERNFYQTTRHNIPEDNTLHGYYYQNHKSWQLLLCSQQGTEEDINV
jgi:hypothetical protein